MLTRDGERKEVTLQVRDLTALERRITSHIELNNATDADVDPAIITFHIAYIEGECYVDDVRLCGVSE